MDTLRFDKAQQLRAQHMQPYAAKFSRSHTLLAARDTTDDTACTIAGRVVLFRDMGKLTFATLQDHTGRLQIAFRKEEVGDDVYKNAMKLIDLGDFIGISGKRFTTQKGEPTILVKEWTMLSKALRQPPEKWHGVQDRETAYRQRYLDTMSNRESFDRFVLRSRFIRAMREFYWSHDFEEVDIPVLVNSASGALATPFATHHEALDLDVYLRIALETHQKECLVGGFDRTFSLGPVFRNEGMDPSHLQEFTMCEHYAAYWDYEDNMKFTEQMFQQVLTRVFGTTIVKIPNRDGALIEADFSGSWPRLTLRDAILQESGIDFDKAKTADDLRAMMKEKNIKLDVDVSKLGRGNLIDQLYKKVSRPNITKPTFIMKHPIDLSPLARRNDDNPDVTDRFQLVVGGWEIVNAYSELIDPVDQAQRFDDQSKAKEGGDADAHAKDDEFVTALEYGCPPCSGWGMGIDRIIALLTQQENLRDVVLFPLMKPEHVKTDGAPLEGMKGTGKKQEVRSPSDSSRADKNQGAPLHPLILSSSTTSLLQHADYGHLLPAAHGLIEAHTDMTKAHLVATGAAMESLAKRFGGDTQTWKVAGMLHDLDWDKLAKDYEAHCGSTLEQLLATIQAPAELLGDIRAHYASKYGAEYPLDTMLRKCLFCVDELTGFIIAVTKVRPSKKIAEVEVSSVKKKLKDKAFAAQVDRSQINQCETLLGITLDEFIGITLEAMKGVASELGL
ncbi:MAG: lysine--tRNA ligase [Candidatus Peribacteraceae bacterium]|nr:lysine--tRNA ligase [Candidatus Peribacteraceae bacterium]